MFYQKVFALFLCLLLFSQASSQTKSTAESKKTEISAEIKKEAVTLLREAAQDVANLKTLENRISFSAEIASLMWFHDEREARAMFQSVVTDFRELLIQADAQYTALSAAQTEDIDTYEPVFGTTSSTQTKLMRKITKAMSVRQQIALAIAEHDPQMSYDFFIGTSQAITNPQIRAQLEGMDSYFEFKLLNTMAEKDPDKALEVGRKILAKGFNSQIISLLKKIYDKDADKGASFGDEVVQKIKSEKTKPDSFYEYTQILMLGAENLENIKNTPGKKPIFSEQALREIAELQAQEILKRQDTGLDMINYISLIEKFSPANAAQIRQKMKANSEKQAANQTAEVDQNEEVKRANVKREKQMEILEQESNLLLSVGNFSKKQIPKEELEKTIKEARESISKIKDPDKKIMALTILASQVAQLGDKETAAKIMDDAQRLIPAQPKNYRDFLQTWMIAGGYAQIDAEKSFPILEDTILRINDTISAFIKVGEFMDINEEILQDGEVQIGGFGRDISRDLFGSLSSADATLRSLAIADFARTKALTNKFDRLEARILAKMLILRAVLSDKKKVAEVKDEI